MLFSTRSEYGINHSHNKFMVSSTSRIVGILNEPIAK